MGKLHLASPEELNPEKFDVRLLTGDEGDTAAYRALRNKIRNSEGARNFANSYTQEDELNEVHCGVIGVRQSVNIVSLVHSTNKTKINLPAL